MPLASHKSPHVVIRECQKVWGNQAAHASVAGVLPGPRFWGDIVDARELLVDHRVDNSLYDPGRGTRLPQRCRLAVCGSCGYISARIRHCPTLFGTPLKSSTTFIFGAIYVWCSSSIPAPSGGQSCSAAIPTWMRRRFIVATKHASKSSFSSGTPSSLRL